MTVWPGALGLAVGAVVCGCHRDVPPRPPAEEPATTAAAPAPRAPPREIDSVCAAVEGVLRHAPLLRVERLPPAPLDSAASGGGDRPSCRVAAYGRSGRDYTPLDSLLAWLRVEGWDDLTVFSADGPDGTVQGHRRNGVTCIVEGRWDGGDDSDPAYVPSDTLEIRVACARTVPADTALGP